MLTSLVFVRDRRATRILGCALVSMIAACSGGTHHADAGPEDAGAADAFVAARDAATCSPSCTDGDWCCPEGAALVCVDVGNDLRHCGACSTDCTQGRGDACTRGMCTCGAVDIGCAGTMDSTCCPPRPGGSAYYCANLLTSGRDCGGCGVTCDAAQSDRCLGGHCRCGLGAACAGTPESTCCRVGTEDEVQCVDTRTDARHCGGCGNRCELGERCENGACTTGASCRATCTGGEMCCDGTCCQRATCLRGACGA